ncbi:MAG: GNAT family N-acetyltransferase [Metallibacterium sp.]
MHDLEPMRTARLSLMPATLAHLDAEIESHAALGQLLRVTVPASWPPGEYDRAAVEFFRKQLLAHPDAIGWFGWYAIRQSTPSESAVLIGAAGYLGPPDSMGCVEVGYSIVPEFRAAGFATELLHALAAHALRTPDVVRVIARAKPANPASIKVLEHCGFQPAKPGSEADMLTYELSKPPA